MDLDLARVANQNGSAGKVRSTWSGGKIHFDENKLLDLVVRAAAVAMSANLSRGLRPDGSGSMPGRKKDGKPRGQGSAISRQLHAMAVGPLTWFIAAHREIPGHIARIMQDVPFRAPPLEAIRAGVHAAFMAALKVAGAAASSGDVGASIDRSSQRRTVGHARRQFASSLGALGVSRRSRLASGLRKLARRSIGSGR